jgi:hypothetical protein
VQHESNDAQSAVYTVKLACLGADCLLQCKVAQSETSLVQDEDTPVSLPQLLTTRIGIVTVVCPPDLTHAFFPQMPAVICTRLHQRL